MKKFDPATVWEVIPAGLKEFDILCREDGSVVDAVDGLPRVHEDGSVQVRTLGSGIVRFPPGTMALAVPMGSVYVTGHVRHLEQNGDVKESGPRKPRGYVVSPEGDEVGPNGPQGYMRFPDTADHRRFRVTLLTPDDWSDVSGGRNLTEQAAHALAARLMAGRGPHEEGESTLLSDELFGRDVVREGDPVGDAVWPQVAGESVRPKYDSVAAAILWSRSLGSCQDDDCGDAQYGNGWHALFGAERAVLHTDSQGFVSAWRVPSGTDLDAYWAGVEAGAVYSDEVECEGHYDDDATLMSGAGIGEATYCDGSCRR